jgi:hypothetical protein
MLMRWWCWPPAYVARKEGLVRSRAIVQVRVETHKTTTTRVLSVLSDTTVTGRDVTPLLPVVVQAGRLVVGLIVIRRSGTGRVRLVQETTKEREAKGSGSSSPGPGNSR